MTEVLAKTTAHSERRGNHTPQPEGRIGVRLHKGAFRGLGGSPGETFHGQTLSLQNLELQWVNPSEVQCWTPPAPEGIAGDIAPPPPFHPRQPHPPSFRPCGREGRFPPAAGALQRPRGSRPPSGRSAGGEAGTGRGFPRSQGCPGPGGLRGEVRAAPSRGAQEHPRKTWRSHGATMGIPVPKNPEHIIPLPPHPHSTRGEPGARREPRGRTSGTEGSGAPLSEGSALSAAVWAGEQPGVHGGDPTGLGPRSVRGQSVAGELRREPRARGGGAAPPGPAASLRAAAATCRPSGARRRPPPPACPRLPPRPPGPPRCGGSGFCPWRRKGRIPPTPGRGQSGISAARTSPSPFSMRNSCPGLVQPEAGGTGESASASARSSVSIASACRTGKAWPRKE